MTVVAKKKKRDAEKKSDADLGDAMTEKVATKKRTEKVPVDDKHVDAGAVRALVGETLARVYQEIYPNYSTHDEQGNVILGISEEAYIVTLAMVVGTDDYTPRKGLKVRDAALESSARYCKRHKPEV